MALFLTEQDVQALLTMPEAIAALEQAFRAQAAGAVVNQPRRRLMLPKGIYHTMVAADLSLNRFGQKAYASFSPRTRFLFLLHDATTGDLLAIMQADRLGQMRTGAATGLAASLLARKAPGLRMGIYGAGWQARSQIEAVCSACEIADIHVYSRSAESRSEFSREIASLVNREVTPVDDPREATEGMDLVITATTSREPVLRGEWLKPGAHVSAVGSNMLSKREIDEKTVERAGIIVVDSIEQSRSEAGDLLPAFEQRLFLWEQVCELQDIVSGRHPGRTHDDEITLFKSNGIALEDVAVADLVYRLASERRVGVELPLDSPQA